MNLSIQLEHYLDVEVPFLEGFKMQTYIHYSAWMVENTRGVDHL